jgi:hypothetical protein
MLGNNRSRSTRTWIGSLSVAILVLALGVASIASAEGSSKAMGNGKEKVEESRPPVAPVANCEKERPAIATGARGVPVSPQPETAPIPCESVIGTSSEAADVGVEEPGSVFFAPLLLNTSTPPENVRQGPEEVVRTTNGGKSWTGLSSGGPTTGGLAPPWMSVDSATHRIWFVTPIMVAQEEACGARISWSDDGGNTWSTNPHVSCPGEGAEKLLEGPAPKGSAKPKGYEHVVYYCANEHDSKPLPIYCYKSLNGGKSFSELSAHPDPTPPPGCAPAHPARVGVVGPEGYLYFPTNLCGSVGVSVSKNEGKTWHNIPTGTTGITDNMYVSSIASDTEGNLFMTFLGPENLPQLIISRDHGQHWTKPIGAFAPNLTGAMRISITANRPGEVALAYLGTTDGQDYNGYITESQDVLEGSRVFWSQSVNNPTGPLVYGSNKTGFGNRLLYATDALSPDGTAWAGFHCAMTSICPGQRLGIAGSLRWRPEPSKSQTRK